MKTTQTLLSLITIAALPTNVWAQTPEAPPAAPEKPNAPAQPTPAQPAPAPGATPPPPPVSPAPAAPPAAKPPAAQTPAAPAESPAAPAAGDSEPAPEAEAPTAPDAQPTTPSEPAAEAGVTSATADAGITTTGQSALPAPQVTPSQVQPLRPLPTSPEPSEPPKQAVVPLHFSGSFFSRYELRENYEEYPTLTHPRLHREGDTFVYRARFGIQTNPVDLGGGRAVSVKFVPQASGTHATQGTPFTIGDVYDLGVYEAFVRFENQSLAVDVGRFEMDYGDALVIGNLGWNETARAFQGGRVRISGDHGYYTDVFASIITEGSATTGEIFSGDQYFYGIYTGFGPLIGEMEFDAYILGRTYWQTEEVVDATTDPATTAERGGATFFTIGTRAKQQINMFDYRAELGLQFGKSRPASPATESPDKFAYQADAQVGISPLRGLRIAIGGLAASGDGDADSVDRAWDPLFPTSHKFLGLADVFGERTNALSGNAEVSYNVEDVLVLKSQAHLLARMHSDNGSDETLTGTEIDTHIIHPIGKGTSLRGMYGIFLPSEDYWGGNDPIHYVEAQFGFDFK